jgi:hypothetical protein
VSIRPARERLLVVGLFAVTMAYIEAAVVVYLRGLYGIDDLLRDLPLLPDQYTAMEIGREAATLLMLVTVGWIAGRRWQDRIGYAAFAFGAWDILYYGWLVVFIGWPGGLLEWDILFLIPLPWWGPVLAPMLIALLFVGGGALAVVRAERGEALEFTPVDWSVAAGGCVLALYLFMADALRAVPDGIEAVSRARPTQFNWPLFLVALLAMAFPLLRALRSRARKPAAVGSPR